MSTLSRFLIFNLLLTAPCKLLAEPSGAMNFYDKNYAESPKMHIGTGDGQQVTAPDNQSPSQGAKASNSSAQSPQSLNANNMGPVESVPPLRIELYVNSLDAKHFDEVISTAIRVVKTRKIPLYNIYHIGDFKNVSSDLVQQLKSLGIVMTGRRAVPEKYEVSQSPVWVMISKKGQYVVEGATDIERFLGPHGEFSVPVRPTPTPQGKMAGFSYEYFF